MYAENYSWQKMMGTNIAFDLTTNRNETYTDARIRLFSTSKIANLNVSTIT